MVYPGRPALLAVDDDPLVLRAIRRDLTHAYADRYRVLTAASGAEGLRVLEELRRRRQDVALLVSDQRMPEMTGIEFLSSTLRCFPAARKVLLTAYADTDVAIAAINQIRLDHYLVKPWEPPTERLYPVLDELLEDWQASYQVPWGGIEIVGYRFAPATHRLRDFLTRYQQPFRFVDAEREADGGLTAAELPAMVLPDGRRLVRPLLDQLVEVLGLVTTASRPFYDLVIVGGGPAGLAAAVSASSEGLATLLVDAEAPGGQAGTTSKIDNYPGFPGGVSGADLVRRAVAQARRFGTEILSPVEAVRLRREGRALVITLSSGGEIGASTVVLSPGLRYRRLAARGARRFEGAGLYYGTTVSEISSCAGQRVWIVGGANSAGQAAVHFARNGVPVGLLVRGENLEYGMSSYLIDEVRKTPGIDVRLGTKVVACEGSDHLERIKLRGPGGDASAEDADYLFNFIGAQPRTSWLSEMVARDGGGFLLTGADLPPPGQIPGWDLPRAPFFLETSVPGVFAAGDVRAGSVKRFASSIGEGSMTTALIHCYMAGS